MTATKIRTTNWTIRPKHCPPGLYVHKRGWAMRKPGQKSPSPFAGRIPYEEARIRFYQLKAQICSAPMAAAVATVSPASPPVPVVTSMGLVELKDKYLTSLNHRNQAGDFSDESIITQRRELRLFVNFFPGKTVDDLKPEDFTKFRASLNKLSLHSVSRLIVNVRTMFTWAVDNYVIPALPRWGSSFEKPDAGKIRQHQNHKRIVNGLQMFEPVQIKALLDNADVRMKAMLLLGLNGGFGNTDLARLPLTTVDLVNGVINFPRPKSGIQRRCPLWQETADALRKWIAVRPKAADKGDDNLVFLTEIGTRMIRTVITENKAYKCDLISTKFNKVAKKANVWRKGLGFYALRHTFETAAKDTGDWFSITRITGHQFKGSAMANTYVERTNDEVLRKVTDHVRSVVLRDWITPRAEIFGEVQRPPLDLDD